VDENDAVNTKAEMIAALKPLPPGLTGNLAIDEFTMRLYGNVAVVTHEDNEYLDYHGQILRSRFRNTDTWLKKDSAWRRISAMVLAVLKDPPAISLDLDTLRLARPDYERLRSLYVELEFNALAKSAAVLAAAAPPSQSAPPPAAQDEASSAAEAALPARCRYETRGRAL